MQPQFLFLWLICALLLNAHALPTFYLFCAVKTIRVCEFYFISPTGRWAFLHTEILIAIRNTTIMYVLFIINALQTTQISLKKTCAVLHQLLSLLCHTFKSTCYDEKKIYATKQIISDVGIEPWLQRCHGANDNKVIAIIKALARHGIDMPSFIMLTDQFSLCICSSGLLFEIITPLVLYCRRN